MKMVLEGIESVTTKNGEVYALLYLKTSVMSYGRIEPAIISAKAPIQMVEKLSDKVGKEIDVEVVLPKIDGLYQIAAVRL